MKSRERIKRILNHEATDRIGIVDSYWPETIEEWHKEGLPEDVEPSDYFDHDIRLYTECDQSLQLRERILEENEETIVRVNNYGMTEQVWRKRTGTPHTMDVLVKTKEDWGRFKNLLQPKKDRINLKTAKEFYEKNRVQDRFITFAALDPYENTWRFHGVERLLMNMVYEPDLIKDMFNTSSDLIIGMAKIMIDEGLTFDGAWLGGDIAYKNGPLFSPQVYEELLFPAHKKICDFFSEQGMPVIYHTDGDVHKLIPYLIKAGITALHPLEVKAGMDVRNLKKEYDNRLVLIGNIDVREMAKSKEEIEEEVKNKILIAKEGGGYIYHSDHSIPPSVNLQNYKYVLEMVIKYGGYNSQERLS